MRSLATRPHPPTAAEAPASRGAKPAPASASAPAAGPLARAERFGHRLDPLAPSPGRLPIQRVRWRWSASANSWSAVGSSSSTSVPPGHQGAVDGEEYDDTYSQSSDPTVKPFLTGGQSFMGESGAKLQAKGSSPAPSDIRVTAVKTPDLSGGSGAHELLPTNMGPDVAKSGSSIAIGLQSGARTSTAHQMFRIGGGDVGGHTGFAVKPTGGPGSTHTRGQGPAHDEMRGEVRSSVLKEKDPDKATNALMLKHLEVTPTGQDIMNSPYIEGMQPNLFSIGTVGPVGKKDPARIRLAQKMHREREVVKRRALAHKRSSKRGRSPSPERTPIDDQGGGGDYLYGPPLPPPPIPTFEGTPGSWQHVSNTASWLTAPQREGFSFSPPTLPISAPTPTGTTTTSTPTTLPPPSLSTPLPSPSTSTPTPTFPTTTPLLPPPTPSPSTGTPITPSPLSAPPTITPPLSLSTPISTPTPTPTPTPAPPPSFSFTFSAPPTTAPIFRRSQRTRKPVKRY